MSAGESPRSSAVRGAHRYDVVKRALDLVAGCSGLVLTAPLQLGIAAVLLVVQGRPVFFRQPRPGRDGAVFEIVKFRTMRGSEGTDLTGEQRITRVGGFLRATSLDELPTLWNVVRGDMSLVGPRPLRVEYLPLYSPQQARRHEVRPGITGLAQVSGRNLLSWEERFALDVEYVDHRSPALDARILALTIPKVFAREGISPEGSAIAESFRGTPTSDG